MTKCSALGGGKGPDSGSKAIGPAALTAGQLVILLFFF